MQTFHEQAARNSSPDEIAFWQSNLPLIGLEPGRTVTQPNSLKLLVDASEFLQPMVQVIDSAEKTISFQFLNMEGDGGGRPIADALIRAAKRGAKVKGILDFLSQALETNGEITIWPWTRQKPAVAKERKATREMFREMRAAGIEIAISFPWFQNGFNRNHRKSLVADQKALVVGGFNPTEHNTVWHEICAVMHGPIALEVERIFNEQFVETGLEPMPIHLPESFSTGPGAKNVTIGLAINEPRRKISIRNHFVRSVDLARTSVRVENAYFSDAACFGALVRAARRGVHVQVIVPRVSNHTSIDWKRDRLAPELKAAGGEIHLYRGMTHAKLFLVDDVMASIGSANFTPLNIRMERELNIVAVDPTGTFGLEVKRRVFDRDIENSDRSD